MRFCGAFEDISDIWVVGIYSDDDCDDSEDFFVVFHGEEGFLLIGK